jgi:hypothetical protein
VIGRPGINRMIEIVRLRIRDDVDRLHVKIDNLNNHLVGFCFIRDIDNKNVYTKLFSN